MSESGRRLGHATSKNLLHLHQKHVI